MSHILLDIVRNNEKGARFSLDVLNIAFQWIDFLALHSSILAEHRALHCIALQHREMRHIALYCITVHCIALYYIASQHIALQYSASQHITLYCITVDDKVEGGSVTGSVYNKGISRPATLLFALLCWAKRTAFY